MVPHYLPVGKGYGATGRPSYPPGCPLLKQNAQAIKELFKVQVKYNILNGYRKLFFKNGKYVNLNTCLQELTKDKGTQK